MLETLLITAAMSFGGIVDLTIPGTLPAVATRDNGKGPAIVHIVSRNQTLTVRSGKTGLLYSLTGTDGKVLVADATAKEFAESHPDLYRQARQFIAVKNDEQAIGASSDIAIDAINKHGAMKGTWRALKRIARCHPFHPGGHDPA